MPCPPTQIPRSNNQIPTTTAIGYWNPVLGSSSSSCRRFTPVLTRRDLLRQSGGGFGLLALADLLSRSEAASGGGNPLAPRAPHFTPRARRVLFLFMHGGPSQVDTFDYKPLLERDHGKPLPFPKPRIVSSQTGNL